MRKMIKLAVICLVLVSVLSLIDILGDKQILRESVIRLHVVGASNEETDQQIKLQVRDVITDWLSHNLSGAETAEEATEFLLGNLNQIEAEANRALEQAGVQDRASVSFQRESFPVRDYDTFSLPSGVYSSLRIRIGKATGRNWWCVVFPSLCVNIPGEPWKDTAVSAGFDQELVGTLAREQEYEIRFFLLDCIGFLENLLFPA